MPHPRGNPAPFAAALLTLLAPAVASQAGATVVKAPCAGPATARSHFGLLNLLDPRYRVHAWGLHAPGLAVVLGLDVLV